MQPSEAMVQSAGMKESLRYDQVSCRLQVDGLPDMSAGQGAGAIGIITGWTLAWLGRPELEGKREHLVALMQVVLPYARHLISGVARPFVEYSHAVEISPHREGGHRLLLRSSQPDTPLLEVRLDDAELADLVRVLDQLRLDPRLQLALPVPPPEPLSARDLIDRRPLHRRLAAPMGGLAALAIAAAVVVLLPTPPAPGPTAPAGGAARPLEPGPSGRR
jgi:hypothetical protein